ncbi:MAG: AEC family transporter [Oscillospiraceae bacterium]|nr:AEC family transporter [Oscillospiraceae bacterium]
MDSTVIFQQMFILVIMMGVGFLIRRLKIIDDGSNVTMSKILLRVTVPATLVYSIVSRRLDVDPVQVPLFLGIILLSFAVGAAVSWVAARAIRAPREEVGAYINLGMYGNVNFMSIPLIVSLIAVDVLPAEAMLYGILYNIIFNLLIFSVGMKLIGGKEAKINLKMILSPVMIGGMLALFFFVINFQLPGVGFETCTHSGCYLYGNVFEPTAMETVLLTAFAPVRMLGAVTAPLSMLLLGSTIGGMKIGELVRGWRNYAITAVKLVVVPVIVFFVLLPMFNGIAALYDYETLLTVIFIANASPMAISVAIFTFNYNKHKEIVAKGLLVSTLLSAITMPILMAIFL